MDKETTEDKRAWLTTSALPEWQHEPSVLSVGAVVLCRSGRAEVRVNFDRYKLTRGAVITLFPGDVVHVRGDADFESLTYTAPLLREACLQLEHTVYTLLREDRCRQVPPAGGVSGGAGIVTSIVEGMFSFLRVYFQQPGCTCLDQLVLLQLKAFFLGFYDYLYRYPQQRPPESGTRRTRELFQGFRQLLEADYRSHRTVQHYAGRLSITPKYLGTIVRGVTGFSAKAVIDHYAILQLKLRLRHSQQSIAEIAWEFHFADASFFSRYFRQHTGLTPGQFRRGSKS
ncbi:MAG: helix-turn-helix transcriptional regulator [Alloprevotella sp.]|nr:helix-turn-helix transcriptional regulator [Alloprevotella sp.]